MELLVVMGIIALLVGAAFPSYKLAIEHADCAGCQVNMHGVGIAFMSYAYDNSGTLPGRTQTGNGDKWPTLLMPYIGSDPSVYVDPGDPVATKLATTSLVSNSSNNSSFIFNGFNDLGAYGNPNIHVNLFNVPSSANLVLLGEQNAGSDQFYMDFVEGNQNDVLKKSAYFGGSNYVFADGSCRFVYASQYSDAMWIVNSTYVIPPVPSGH